jgi:hypothetical protein
VDQESNHMIHTTNVSKMPLAKSKKTYVEKRCLYCVSEGKPKAETHNVVVSFILKKKAQQHEPRTDDAERSVNSEDSEKTKRKYRTKRITANNTQEAWTTTWETFS